MSTWPSRTDALLHEVLLHEIFDVAKNPNFYNKARQTSTKFTSDTTGMRHKSETIALFKQQKSGKNNPNYGKRGLEASAFGHQHTLEQKGKMANLGEKNGMYNKKHSERSKNKMRENRGDSSGVLNPFFGKKHKEESKRRGIANHMFGVTGGEHHNAIRCHTTHGWFESVTEAATEMKCCDETIRNRIKSSQEKFKEYYY